MTYLTGLRSAVCGAALIAGGAAQADVTAAQVWDDWKSQMEMYGEGGLTVGSEDASGDTLTVRDVVLSIQDAGSDMTAAFGDISFAEQGDGTVLVTMADSYPITIKDGGAVITVIASQTGLEMVVSGDPGATNYAITADTYTIALQDVVDGDFTFAGDVQLVVNDLSSNYSVETADLRTIVYDASIASFDVLVDVEVPGADGDYITGGGKTENMTLQGQMVMPLDVDFEAPEDMFAKGFSLLGGYKIESSAYVFDVNEGGDQVSGSASTGQTTLDAEMNNDAVSYDVRANDLAVDMSSSELPFPVQIGLGEYGIGFEMPLSKSDTPSDFGMSVDLVDLTLNDMIWNLFDPSSVLPRDAATVQIGLSGLAKPLFDLMDPAQQAAMNASDMPFELASVSLDRLKVAVAGALVTGQGAFTFDSTDMQSFAPLPKPEGDVIIEASGLNALMDNMATMGLIAQDDLMAPRMMMGMFARSTGDDQMETKLEVTADGQVLANGQRLR